MRKPRTLDAVMRDPWPVHPDPRPVCKCECHQNPNIMHFGPCCDLTYQQYINPDGTVNNKKLGAAIVRCNPRTFGPVRNVLVLVTPGAV
jgi:hypothetical protein